MEGTFENLNNLGKVYHVEIGVRYDTLFASMDNCIIYNKLRSNFPLYPKNRINAIQLPYV